MLYLTPNAYDEWPAEEIRVDDFSVSHENSVETVKS